MPSADAVVAIALCGIVCVTHRTVVSLQTRCIGLLLLLCDNGTCTIVKHACDRLAVS